MGSIVTRKDWRRVIQWVDGSGKQRQETLKAKGADGRPLSPRAADQLARRRLAELEEKARRQRHGLEPLPSESLKMTFGELMDWWWEHKGKTLRSHAARHFLPKHLKTTLGPLPLREVTAARIQRLLADKSKELGPKSLNDLRAFVFNFYEVARKQGGPWEGRTNPVADVERFKVTAKPRKFLSVEEFELVLAEVPRRWEGPVATGLYAGLREGEIFGLLKEDVDLRHGVMMVWRSWDSPRTKDGKALPVPIAAPLKPRLEAALRSPGPLLFARRDGSMHHRGLRLNRMLRSAIARAGIVEGYQHRCRAPGCGYEARRHEASPPARCPRCGKPTVWAKAIPRHVTFHGTRHSFATAVVRSAGTAVAQKALRHSDVRLTIHTYGHLDDRDVREGLEKVFPPLRAEDADCKSLQTAPEPGSEGMPFVLGTAAGAAQPPGTPAESGSPAIRTDARTAPSAAWARTRCSSAA